MARARSAPSDARRALPNGALEALEAHVRRVYGLADALGDAAALRAATLYVRERVVAPLATVALDASLATGRRELRRCVLDVQVEHAHAVAGSGPGAPRRAEALVRAWTVHFVECALDAIAVGPADGFGGDELKRRACALCAQLDEERDRLARPRAPDAARVELLRAAQAALVSRARLRPVAPSIVRVAWLARSGVRAFPFGQRVEELVEANALSACTIRVAIDRATWAHATPSSLAHVAARSAHGDAIVRLLRARRSGALARDTAVTLRCWYARETPADARLAAERARSERARPDLARHLETVEALVRLGGASAPGVHGAVATHRVLELVARALRRARPVVPLVALAP